MLVGGAGTKILAAAEGVADLAIMHFGTSLWDTCAPEAIARALGGRVTDLFGSPLIHLSEPPSGSLKNGLGVVASAPGASDAHDALCARSEWTHRPRTRRLTLLSLAPSSERRGRVHSAL